MPRNTIQVRIERMLSYRCAYLFFSQVLLFVLLPFLQASEAGRIAANLLNIVIMITAITAMGRSRLSLATALLLALPALALAVTGIVFNELRYLVLSWGFSSAVYVVALVSLLRYIFSPAAMTTDKLYGAASAYLLLGVLWAYMYVLLEQIYPGSFAIAGT
ncbi:MAG: potassium channel family protein, partial [Nitrospiraceae bacterium]